MKNLKLGTLTSLAASFAILSSAMASPPTVRHDFQDIAAARQDIQRLKMDRARAKRFGNWSKVAQDDRLIESDRFWIQRDKHRIEHSRG